MYSVVNKCFVFYCGHLQNQVWEFVSHALLFYVSVVVVVWRKFSLRNRKISYVRGKVLNARGIFYDVI